MLFLIFFYSKVLLQNQSLSHLSLRSNNIKETGLLALGESIKQNNSLKSLSIFGNCFSHNTGSLYFKLKDMKSASIKLDIEVYTVDGEYLTAETEECKNY